MLTERLLPGSALLLFVAAICFWGYFKATEDKSGSQAYVIPVATEFDGFFANEFSISVLNEKERAASVYLGFVAQRIRRHHGFSFDSYSELDAKNLNFRFEPLGDVYKTREILYEMISRLSDSDGWPSWDDEKGIRKAFSAESSNRKRITRLRAAPATIEFRLGAGGAALVTAGHLETHLADTGLISLSGGVEFHQEGSRILSAATAVWDINENRFFAPYSRNDSSQGHDALSVGHHMACVPWSDVGFVCKISERYPRIPPDPLNLAASKIRSNLYHSLGLCKTMLGTFLCQSEQLSLHP